MDCCIWGLQSHFFQKYLPLNLLAAIVLLAGASTASEKPWTEVRSQHFRVITDGSEGQAKRLAREFEQIRFAIAGVYPNIRLDSGAPLLVVAPEDENSAKALEPARWKAKGFKPAGLFRHGWDKQFALVRLDEVRPEANEVIYHEYVHSVMHLNLRWIPIWLDEGMAEFYANTRFEKNRIMIGAPSWRMRVLRSRELVPLDTLLHVTPASPYYHDESKADIFYAESWLLTHFLFFGPGMDRGARILHFTNALQEGKKQSEVFEEAFGDPKQLEKNFNQYAASLALNVGYLNVPPQAEEKDFASRKLSLAETEAELGGYSLWSRDLTTARPLIEKALKDDPKLGLAHENMGFLYFTEGKDEEAAREFTEALQLDGKLWLSLFAQTMMSPMAHSGDPTDQDKFREALKRVTTINPLFAPAVVQLARLAVSQGDLKQALEYSRKAERLEPARAGYYLLTGQILRRMGRGAEAALFAKHVVERWPGADHDEAVELWNSIPADQRPPDESLSPIPLQGARATEGRVKAVKCGEGGSGMTVTIDKEGQPLTFVTKGSFRGGFADTLWFGEDHFNFCRHMEGLRAVLHYRPSTDPQYAGEIAVVDYRDDLPNSASNGAPIKDVSAEKKP
ncbi:MAG TPA: tetratricopeptide repeat protein [Candidatus Angelobacter sp.]|nr:tetratricopeptide repeat protein [Candidatus Angelobacter sp.]